MMLRPASWPDLFPEGASEDGGWEGLWETAVFDPTPWTALVQQTDPKLECPCARRDVQVELLPGDKGAILSDPDRSVYLHLASEDHFLWEQIDGTRNQIDLVVSYCMRYKSLAPTRIAALVSLLRNQGLLTTPPDKLYEDIRQHLQRQTISGRINYIIDTVLRREIAISGIDNGLGWLYDKGVWLIFTWPVQLLFWLIAITGTAAFGYLSYSRQFSLLGEGTLVEGAATLVVFQIIALFLHEAAHAFTVKAFNRRVHRAGLFILLGLIGVFVDTTDIWPAGKKAQLWVTWAGPFVNTILGGLAALLIVRDPTVSYAPLAFQFAVSQYALVLINLTPFLRLDGYYLLADWLEIPNLRARAMGFVQTGLPNRLRQAWNDGRLLPRLSRDEKYLTAFGVISTLWIVNLLGLAVVTAPIRLFTMLEQVVQGRIGLSNPLSLLFFLVGGIFTILLLVRSVTWLQTSWGSLLRRQAQAAAWRMTLVFTAVALLIAAVPDLLRQQDNLVAAQVYAHVIALGVSGCLLFYGWRLVQELAGARWQISWRGFWLTAVLLTLLNLFAVARAILPDLLPTLPLAWLRLAALVPLLAGLMLAPSAVWRLVDGALGWVLGLMAAAVGALVTAVWLRGSETIVYFPLLAGHTLLATALLVCWQLTHRPPLARRVGQVVAEDPARLLGLAVAAVAEEMAQAAAGMLSKAGQLEMANAFNTAAAHANWPVWLTMTGTWGERMSGEVGERTAVYQAALAELRRQIGARLGEAFAADAQAQAVAELPLAAQLVCGRWLELGGEAVGPDDRVQLRLAGRRLAETLVLGCARAYGWMLTNEVVGAFNRMAATAGWGIYLRGNGRLNDEQAGDLLAVAQTYGDALQDLLGRVAAITGTAFVERGVVQLYDSLPWQTREVANTWLFSRLSWARGLALTATEPRLAFLATLPLLNWLTAEELATLRDGVRVRRVAAGQMIATSGDYLEQLLLVRRGSWQAVAQVDGLFQVTGQGGSGSLLGVRELVAGESLAESYVAQTDVELWLMGETAVLSRLETLLPLYEALDEQQAIVALLGRIPLFAGLSSDQRLELAAALESLPLPLGAVVVQEGEPGQGLYVVQEGDLTLWAQGRRVARLGVGELFGETALLQQAPLRHTVRAETAVVLLRLPVEAFYRFLDEELVAALDQMQSRRLKERDHLWQADALVAT